MGTAASSLSLLAHPRARLGRVEFCWAGIVPGKGKGLYEIVLREIAAYEKRAGYESSNLKTERIEFSTPRRFHALMHRWALEYAEEKYRPGGGYGREPIDDFPWFSITETRWGDRELRFTLTVRLEPGFSAFFVIPE